MGRRRNPRPADRARSASSRPHPPRAADPSTYEPDGTSASATPFTVGGAVQQHTVHRRRRGLGLVRGHGRVQLRDRDVRRRPAEPMDTVLRLYGADSTLLTDDDGGTGVYSRIEYVSEASRTVFAQVTGYDAETTGAYALAVTATAVPGTLARAPGRRLRRRDGRRCQDADDPGPEHRRRTGHGGRGEPGSVRRLVDRLGRGQRRHHPGRPDPQPGGPLAPTTAYTGPPVAESRESDPSLVAQYLSAQGVRRRHLHRLPERRRRGRPPLARDRLQPSTPPCNPVFDQTGSAAVVPGGRYNVRTVVSALPGSGTVSVLAPVTALRVTRRPAPPACPASRTSRSRTRT